MTQQTSTEAASITAKAAQFMNGWSKRDLVKLARANGWRGDDARTAMLQLALYCASKGLSPQQSETQGTASQGHATATASQGQAGQGQGQGQGEQGQGEQGEGEQGEQGEGEQGQGEQGEGEQGEQGEGEQGEQGEGEQGEQGEGGDKPQPAEGQQDKPQPQPAGEQPKGKPMQAKFAGKCAACNAMIPEGAPIMFDATAPKGKRVRHAPTCPQPQQGAQPQPGQQGQGEQPAGEQSAGQAPGNSGSGEQPSSPARTKAPNNKEWAAMLAATGITKPHPMLRKVHALAIVARLDVMLVGPAGCGKTMLGEQLARLINYSFGLNSMTAGVSESAITGWLLPVGEAGKFEYVPTQYVTGLEQGKHVHLLDELDRADQNMPVIMNESLANGHMSIPHNLKKPRIKRSETFHVLAAVNTLCGGADEIYTAATALDGSTIDRFYMVAVDYDKAYEASLFNITVPAQRQWAPRQEMPTQADYDAAHTWLTGLRQKQESLKIPRVVGTRMFQKTLAAMNVGCSLKEVRADLLMAWTPDELRRAQESR